ncbi:unnamed protein product [Calicophoron daubneyi]|uniref:DUF4536 domain-containing protein n=1 Tax=Calicophoron daubneyi TaxID=300641 RepID=A0AAV2T8J8_CALDB
MPKPCTDDGKLAHTEGRKSHENTLQIDDCVGCKLVAAIAPLALTGYIVYVAKQQFTKYTGAQRIAYVGFCGGLSAGLIILSGSQLFRRKG